MATATATATSLCWFLRSELPASMGAFMSEAVQDWGFWCDFASRLEGHWYLLQQINNAEDEIEFYVDEEDDRDILALLPSNSIAQFKADIDWLRDVRKDARFVKQAKLSEFFLPLLDDPTDPAYALMTKLIKRIEQKQAMSV